MSEEIRKKYVLIHNINENHDHEECPYCTGPLADYFTGKNLGKGCGNCDLEIRDTDYLHAIKYILKYGENKPEIKHKTLEKF